MKPLPGLFLFLLVGIAEAQQPLTRGHAHNDYEHEFPLVEALKYGYISVEVDVHYIENGFYVAHDLPSSTQGLLTIEELYLDPLLERVKANDGFVYPGYQNFFYLMIDVKTAAEESYLPLKQLLSKYEAMISVVSDSSDQPQRPVKIFISGNVGRPFDQLLADSIKYSGIDGRPDELGLGIPPSLMPVVSQNYNHYMSWKGTNKIDQVEVLRLKELIAKVHDEGKKVRLWACPDIPVVWDFLLSLGVDLINTDRLKEFKDFYSDYEYR